MKGTLAGMAQLAAGIAGFAIIAGSAAGTVAVLVAAIVAGIAVFAACAASHRHNGLGR